MTFYTSELLTQLEREKKKNKEKTLFHPINYMDAIPKGEAEWAETPSSVPQHNNTA